MASSPDEPGQDGSRIFRDPHGKLAIASVGLAAGLDLDMFGKFPAPQESGASLTLAALLVVATWLQRSSAARRPWVRRLVLFLVAALFVPAAITPGPYAATAALTSAFLAISALLAPVKPGRLFILVCEVLPLAFGTNFAVAGISLLTTGHTSFGAAFICFGLGFIGTGAAIIEFRIHPLLVVFAFLGLSTIAISVLVLLAGDHAAGVVGILLGGVAIGLSTTGIILLHRSGRARQVHTGPEAATPEIAPANGLPLGPDGADEVVVLVHGTFSADKSGSDEGERWWQQGSTTWAWLQEHLPEGVALGDDQVGVFHWSGNNSQADRYAASTKLLAYLVGLERAGRRYHLVGHSHGGSLIWEALISSVQIRAHSPRRVPKELLYELESGNRTSRARNRRRARRAAQREIHQRLDLAGLRTWTTVGTPFLHHLPRKRRFIRGWPQSTFSLFGGDRELLGRGILALIVFVVGYILIEYGIAVGRDLLLGKAALSEVLSFLLFLIFALAYRRRINIRNFSEGLIQRERSSCYAFLVFADRWLGIWSPYDEAIAALKASAPRMACDYTWLCSSPKTRPPQPVPNYLHDILTDRSLQLRLPQPRGAVQLVPDPPLPSAKRFLSPFYYSYNRWLSPRAGQVVSRILLRSAQGCDVPGAFLAYVTPWPVPVRRPMGGLPAHISRSLETEANAGAEKVGPEFRRLLANIAIDGSQSFGSVIPDKALVHTSYFDHPDVLRLITLHISLSRNPGWRPSCEDDRPDLWSWLLRAKKKVAARYQQFVTEVERSWASQKASIIHSPGRMIDYYSSRLVMREAAMTAGRGQDPRPSVTQLLNGTGDE